MIKNAKMAERLRNRLQSDSIPVRIRILASSLNNLFASNYILKCSKRIYIMPRWRSGYAIACRAIPFRFESGSWLLLIFLMIFSLFSKLFNSLFFTTLIILALLSVATRTAYSWGAIQGALQRRNSAGTTMLSTLILYYKRRILGYISMN